MKKIFKLFLLTVIGSLFFGITILADDEGWDQNIKSIQFYRKTELLPPDIKHSVGYGDITRGNYLASSELHISNEGYGSIGILGSTLCHVPVKKIRMAIYLDRWDETQERWIQVDYYNFTYEDKEEKKDLTAVTEAFSVIGLPTGCYYRLRSFNCVWPFSGGSEMQGPVTDGILITDGAV